MTTTTLSTDATVIDQTGFAAAFGVTVIDHGDRISIGDTVHLKDDDLKIEDHRIVSIHGWEIAL